MFKKILADLQNHINDIKKLESIQKLEEFKQKITIEFDKAVDSLYDKKDLWTEAIFKKKELKKQKISVFNKFKNTSWLKSIKYLISAPFIYMMLIPAFFMHFCLEIYHQICFRLYEIPRCKPSEHFFFDRAHLAYLNWFEKFNCIYCSYFNGLAAYTKEVAGRTERFWCPIKHAQKVKYPHQEYGKFVEYLEGEKLRKNWDDLRCFKNK